jgi:hypothetical protein
MTLPLMANTELVAMAVLAEIFGSSNYISTTLPTADSRGAVAWYDTGFVTVASIGGSSSNELAMNNPVVSLDFWAAPKPGTQKPPWGKANNLAEVARKGFRAVRPHSVTLPGQFPAAIVFTAFFVSEPLRLPDVSSFARYTCQAQINWGSK